jgi:hypothetical protein
MAFEAFLKINGIPDESTGSSSKYPVTCNQQKCEGDSSGGNLVGCKCVSPNIAIV